VLNTTRINNSRDREVREKETHSTKKIGKGAGKMKEYTTKKQ
jgi:hypothetical protein